MPLLRRKTRKRSSSSCPSRYRASIRSNFSMSASATGSMAPGTSGGSVEAQELGHPEREVERLPGVEPGVAHRRVAGVEVVVEDLLGPAEAFRDVVAGQLNVHATRPCPLGPVR